MKKKISKLQILLLLIFGMNLQAQDKTIPLWEDKIPGEIITDNYNEKEVFKDNELQSTSNVKVPTITIFTPTETKAKGTAVIIFPGGAYSHLAMNKEGKKVAKWLNSLGITAFLLKYRMPSDLTMKDKTIGPLQDAQEAVRMIRNNAIKWNLDPAKIGVIGFSAGGHLAATLSTNFSEITYESLDTTSPRPDFTILIYPVISMQNEITHKGSKEKLLGLDPSVELINKFSCELHVNATTPNTFIVHATDDQSVPVENSINYYLALKNNKIQCELHLYEKGGHGFGLGVLNTSKNWTFNCENWLENNNYITSNPK
jgi:acetyl esterase/lipase